MNPFRYLRELGIALALAGFFGCSEPKVVDAPNPQPEIIIQPEAPIEKPESKTVTFSSRFKVKFPEYDKIQYIYTKEPVRQSGEKHFIFDESGTCKAHSEIFFSETTATVYIPPSHKDGSTGLPDFSSSGIREVFLEPQEVGQFTVVDELPPKVKITEWGPPHETNVSILTEPGMSLGSVYVDNQYEHAVYDRKKGVLIIRLGSNRKSISFSIRDPAENIVERTYQAQRKGVYEKVGKGLVVYDGEVGEKIHNEFGDLIQRKITEMKSKYGKENFIIEITDYDIDHPTSGSPIRSRLLRGRALPEIGTIWVEGKLFTGAEGPKEGLCVLAHEFGHIVDQFKSSLTLSNDFEDATRTNILAYFDPDRFVEGELEIPYSNDFGPPDTAELYAEAFAIYNMGDLPEFESRYFPKFTEEQRGIARRIFSKVREH